MKRTNVSVSEMTKTYYHIVKQIKCRKELTITSESYKTKTEAKKHIKRGYIVANKKQIEKLISEGWIDTQVVTEVAPQPKTAAQLKKELNAECTEAEYVEYLELKAQAKITKKTTKQHTNTYHKPLTESQKLNRERYNAILKARAEHPTESITETTKVKQPRFSQKELVNKILPRLIANKNWRSLLQASTDQLGFLELTIDMETVLESKGYKVSSNLEKWIQDGIIEYFRVQALEQEVA